MIVNRSRKTRPRPELSRSVDSRSRRGRPMLRPSQLRPQRDVFNVQLLKSQTAVQSGTSSKALLSPLELLPIELIQSIFFYSFEVNLPRASFPLADALSTPSIYKALTLFAYFDDDGENTVEESLFLPAEYRYLSTDERSQLQTNIVHCRWYTYDHVKECMPALSRLQMVQAWHQEVKDEAELREATDGGIVISTDHPIDGRAAIPPLEDTIAMEEHFLAKAAAVTKLSPGVFTHIQGVVESDSLLPRIVRWGFDRVDRSEDRVTKTLSQARSVLAAVVIPDWLVRGGPWINDNIQLLQLLRQGYGCIPPQENRTLNMSGGAMLEGMSNAIKEKKVDALTTLLEMHKQSTEDSCQEGMPNSKSEVPVWPLLPADLFRIATEQGSYSSVFINLLIRRGREFIPRDDSVLTCWALQAQTEGSAIGRWLLDYMAGLCLEDTWPHGSEKSFAEELGYLDQLRPAIRILLSCDRKS